MNRAREKEGQSLISTHIDSVTPVSAFQFLFGYFVLIIRCRLSQNYTNWKTFISYC